MNMIISRARSCLGARFRLHGRDPASGLDCVGLAAFAAGLGAIPTGYALRGGTAASLIALIESLGLELCTDQPGTIQLVLAGPQQLHLIVRSEAGFIHADAALRRVVERPGEPPWPVLGRWCVKGD